MRSVKKEIRYKVWYVLNCQVDSQVAILIQSHVYRKIWEPITDQIWDGVVNVLYKGLEDYEVS